MGEALFMIFFLPMIIGGLLVAISSIGARPTDAEKSHYYAVKEYERKHPEDKVVYRSDMK